MRSSLRKLRDLTFHKSAPKGKRVDAQPLHHVHSEDRLPIIQTLVSQREGNVSDEQHVLPTKHRQEGGDIETLAPDVEVLAQMREEYDCLLAAAQTVSSSAYDFSRSIHDMGSCIMETFEKIGDNELGSSLSMLVKVQYEISKLLEHYAARVSQTFIESTKNLLEELELVEEIREQYQRKR